MHIFKTIVQGINMFRKFITELIAAIKKRRVHVWAAYYFIGIWVALEPMITFFRFSEANIELIKNLGIALFPLVIIAAWFRGEPGPQKFKRSEGVALMVGALIFGFIYYGLSRTQPPLYTVITPNSSEQNRWLHENIIKEFERDFHVKIELKSITEDYEGRLSSVLETKNDSLRILLVKASLHSAWALLNENKDLMVPYHDSFSEYWNANDNNLDTLVSRFDALAARFGRNEKSDNKLYFMPAEYETMVLVYLKSKVEEAVEKWTNQKDEIDSAFLAATGYSLPPGYDLEADPNSWDSHDIFVASWYWTHQEYGGDIYARLASPCADDMNMFSNIINKALSHGATLDEIFNLAEEKGMTPAEPIVEVFCWESIFRQARLYYPGMWLGKGLTQQEIIEVFKAGKIFMAFTSNVGLTELVTSNSDIQVATLPAGASMSGKRGLKHGFSNVWYWAVAKTSPSYDLSYRLAEWLTNKENQSKVANKYFFIPTRTELLQDGPFESSSNKIVWQALRNQIGLNKSGITDVNPFKDSKRRDLDILLHFYYNKWQDIVKRNAVSDTTAGCNRKYIIGSLMF